MWLFKQEAPNDERGAFMGRRVSHVHEDVLKSSTVDTICPGRLPCTLCKSKKIKFHIFNPWKQWHIQFTTMGKYFKNVCIIFKNCKNEAKNTILCLGILPNVNRIRTGLLENHGLICFSMCFKQRSREYFNSVRKMVILWKIKWKIAIFHLSFVNKTKISISYILHTIGAPLQAPTTDKAGYSRRNRNEQTLFIMP